MLPSEANFLFCQPPEPGAKALYEALKERNILIRYFGAGPVADSVRISVGTDEQIDAPLEEISKVVSP